MPLIPAKVLLLNPYELGRQPFALAHPAALLEEAGFVVTCLDLSLQKLQRPLFQDALLVAIYVGMHTATRIAVAALPRIKELAPDAHLCTYGLYAPMNAAMFKSLGVGSILGGEFEPDLLALALGLKNKTSTGMQTLNLSKIRFTTPQRNLLPPLNKYAHLITENGVKVVTGFAEASRGCKHLCRHCPVVPVYQGKFRIVPVEVVLSDIRNQVAQGAQHISFGDPDFFNGPAHALKIVRRMHEEFPHLSYDVTIKIQHIIKEAKLLPTLKETGCLFITSAVESIDDTVLEHFAKRHTAADFIEAVRIMRANDIHLAPTFVPFTPWTTLENYVALLQQLYELQLIENIPPVQLAIRLLIPQGSYLLTLPGFAELIEEFDIKNLGYTWTHPDTRVDQLQSAIQSYISRSDVLPRTEIFANIWRLAHEALEIPVPSLSFWQQQFIPHMSEPWYCCAEPTDQQLQAF